MTYNNLRATVTTPIESTRPIGNVSPARERLQLAARRDPAAVLGALEYWLTAEAEGDACGDE